MSDATPKRKHNKWRPRAERGARPRGEQKRDIATAVRRGARESLPVVMDRPKTRKDCLDRELGTLENPCPYVTCKFHLALDITDNGGILFMTEHVFKPVSENGEKEVPEIDIGMMTETCALNRADQGETQLEAMSKFVPLTTARLHTILNEGIEKLKEPLAELYDDAADGSLFR